MTVSERASRYLAAMDQVVAGQAGHDQTFKAAVALVHGFALDGETARALLSKWNQTNCRPPWSAREIDHKINSAMAHPGTKPRGYLLDGEVLTCKGSAASIPVRPSNPKWPKKEPELIIDLLKRESVTVEQMKESSIVPVGKQIAPVEIVDLLFSGGPAGGNEWLCFGSDQYSAVTKRRSDWSPDEIDSQQFIVPNPMTGAFGLIQEGIENRESARCNANVGKRRFLVIECDFDRKNDPEIYRVAKEKGMNWFDVGATITAELACYAPLVSACSSAGKSVHSWFAVQDQSEEQIEDFMRFANRYGADYHTFSAVSFVRLPNGIRPGKGKQELLFLDNTPELFAWV